MATLIALSIHSFATAGNGDAMQQTFVQANKAYDSGDYASAAKQYNAIADAGYANWEVYYNLGNCHYRLDEPGLSIANYCRALRLAPNKTVIKDNLALARSKATDNIEQLPKSFLVQWTQSIVSLASPRGWRVILVLFVFVLSASICIFFCAREYKLRKYMFIVGAVLLFFTLFSAFNAAISVKNVTNKDEAVVIEPMVVVKSSPDAKSVDKFILHEGAELTITDRQDHWRQIKIADGKSGWIDSGIETI